MNNEKNKKDNLNDVIQNPHHRVIEDLKIRNQNNGDVIASNYFGGTYTYNETFQMFEDYKKGFLSLDGVNTDPIVISAPSTVASVNSFYGAIDADKIAVPTSPGFLTAFTEKFTKDIHAKTIVVFDGFLNEMLIEKLAQAGIKNVIITSITDYMHPQVKEIGIKTGAISDKDFLDEYVKSGKKLPKGMQFIRLPEFAKQGASIKETTNFPYQKDKIAAYFLTGASTSRIPKGVKVYVDGLNKMAQIYDKTWFDFKPSDIQALFIPLFYGTGAIHGVHAGLFSGMTLNYKPKYDRFAFAKDLVESHAKIALVAPSHMATLEEAGLEDGALSHVEYIFLGGEAITPAQMEKYRKTAKRLGIKYVLNGYGMTETACMSGISDKNAKDGDVTISPVPGVTYRIVNPTTREVLPDNQRGVLEVDSPCKMAGYTNPELDEERIMSDGYVNTGDIAVHYGNQKYRVFGRETDVFVNQGTTYAMFDIEEAALKHPGIAEAEVTKFTVNNEEYPALVIVVSQEWQNKLKEILEYINQINVPGSKYLIGTRFIDNFKTNPITAKRDYICLTEQKQGYYKLFENDRMVYQTDIDEKEHFNCYPIYDKDVIIYKDDMEQIRSLKK